MCTLPIRLHIISIAEKKLRADESPKSYDFILRLLSTSVKSYGFGRLRWFGPKFLNHKEFRGKKRIGDSRNQWEQ
jgi:hypothetical protein